MEIFDTRLALFQIQIRRGFYSAHRSTRKYTSYQEAVANIPAREKQQLDSNRCETPTLVGVFASNLQVEAEL